MRFQGQVRMPNEMDKQQRVNAHHAIPDQAFSVVYNSESTLMMSAEAQTAAHN